LLEHFEDMADDRLGRGRSQPCPDKSLYIAAFTASTSRFTASSDVLISPLKWAVITSYMACFTAAGAAWPWARLPMRWPLAEASFRSAIAFLPQSSKSSTETSVRAG